MVYSAVTSGLAGIFQFLADLHTQTGWDPAVGEMFQNIANELLGK